MKKVETIGVMLIMQTILFLLGYMLQVKPYSENRHMAQDAFNLLTQLYLSYLMLLFTEFTEYEI